MKKKQAVLAVMLIFLFTLLILIAGLTISERALHQVSGYTGDNGAISLTRDSSGTWVFTFAGRSLPVDRRIWQVFRSQP